MGRSLLLQDDTGFSPLSYWSRSDASSVSITDPEVVAALERCFALSLAPLRNVAEDEPVEGFWDALPWIERIDLPLDQIPEEALAAYRRAAAAQIEVNERAWVAPGELIELLTGLLAALGPEQGQTDQQLQALLQEEQGPRRFQAIYLEDGLLYQEIADLMAMCRRAILRGARRVRLYIE
jgi:hypothetical protein